MDSMYYSGLKVNVIEKYEKEIEYLKSMFNMVTNKWIGLKPKSVKKVLIAIELKNGMKIHKDICYENIQKYICYEDDK